VTPNIQKSNHNAKTFSDSARRFKFNEHTEAAPDVVTKDEKGKSVFDWRNIKLTGMKSNPTPGPGEYRYPSEFGHYISEKVILSR